MKVAIVVLIGVGLFGFFKLNDLSTKPIHIYYISKGISADTVEKALSSWSHVAIFKQCTMEKNADLILQVVNKRFMVNPINYGEYKDKTVNVNSCYNFNKRSMQIILAHEVGHFLGLSHTSNKHSIMNDLTPLDHRKITTRDIEQAESAKFKTLLKIAIGRIF